MLKACKQVYCKLIGFFRNKLLLLFCSAAFNTAVLQGPCMFCKRDHLHLKSNHDKFQLNPIRNC